MRSTSDRSTDSPPTYIGIVVVKRDDQLVAAIETVIARDGAEYTAKTLPVSIDSLATLATDPRIGLQTTQGYNDAGEQIEGFRDSAMSTGSGNSSGSSEVTMSSEVETVPGPSSGGN
jgi:hypothetical protein